MHSPHLVESRLAIAARAPLSWSLVGMRPTPERDSSVQNLDLDQSPQCSAADADAFCGRTRRDQHIFDKMIAKLPDAELKALDKRYGPLTLEPRKLKFIDRIVADSRDVALNHTAGLSLPQQVMMSLFSLAEMMDEKKAYQAACMEIVNHRLWALLGACSCLRSGSCWSVYLSSGTAARQLDGFKATSWIVMRPEGSGDTRE
jgi:hypothetical protein